MMRMTTLLHTMLALLPVLAMSTVLACGSDRSTVVLVPGEEGIAGAAGDDSDYWGDDWADEEPGAEDAGPPPEPFSMPFAGMFGQEVQWSALRVSVLDARIERGMDREQESTDEWGFPTYLGPADIYVELDVKIRSEDKDIVDFSTRATWDLILADGTRVMPANVLGLLISPGDTARTTLRYVVDDVIDLAGTSLELNGEERGNLEPEHIPLDAKHERQFPLRLTEAMGQVIEPQGDFADRGVKIEVIDARYDVNDPILGVRTPEGRRFVWLDLVLTAVRHGYYASDDVALLIVDGRSYSVELESDDGSILDAGISANLHIAFTIDAGMKEFGLAFMTDEGVPQQRIAIDLDNAVLVDE